MKALFDIESETIVSLEQLYDEFTEMKKNNPSEYDYTFFEYLQNCLTRNNGTIEIIELKH